MTDEPELVLSHTCEFRGNVSNFLISFYCNHLRIKNIATNLKYEKIKYSELNKIKSGSKHLRIIFKSGEELSIPCTLAEIKKVKALFKKSTSCEEKSIDGAAYVEFGELGFFVKINSNNYNELRTIIIQRIAKHFYPAIDQEIVSLESFEKFTFKIKKGNIKALLENTNDLDAALKYFENKIDLIIEKDDS